MRSGRYDGVERDYFFPRVIDQRHGFAKSRGRAANLEWLISRQSNTVQMKVVSLLPTGAMMCLAVLGLPAAAAPPVAGCFNSHCDTALDIMHADITARLVGCEAQSSDRVLVNGQPQDGILWTLFGVAPAKELPIDPHFRLMLTVLRKPVPTTYPELRFRLKPGYYNALTVSVGDCFFRPIPLATTDASGNRHIVLIRQRSSVPPSVSQADGGGVYGYAPLPDLQIVLTGGVPEQTLVARDEVDPNPLMDPHGETYMYFFDAVKPGRYAMAVSGYGWTKSVGDVVVTKPGEIVLRYIHDNELGL